MVVERRYGAIGLTCAMQSAEPGNRDQPDQHTKHDEQNRDGAIWFHKWLTTIFSLRAIPAARARRPPVTGLAIPEGRRHPLGVTRASSLTIYWEIGRLRAQALGNKINGK